MNLNEYFRVASSCHYEGKSALWTDLSSALKAQLDQMDAGDDAQQLQLIMDRLGKKLHYGYFHLESATELEEKIAEVRAIRKACSWQLKQINRELEGRLEDIASYVFLDSVDLLDEYLELVGSLAFRPDMSSARHFYYAHQLRETLGKRNNGPARVLEIGAGAGNLAICLNHYGLVADYTIIDLPEMLLMSGINLESSIGCSCRFQEFPPESVSQPSFYMISADKDLASIPDGIFDLALNFNSFSEMPPTEVNAYFSTLYRTTRTGAVFMNVNRIQEHRQEDGHVFEMNPLRFPYDSSARILKWDADPFQQFVRQFCRLKHVKTTAITRMEVVRDSNSDSSGAEGDS
jgi:hypothetical protein